MCDIPDMCRLCKRDYINCGFAVSQDAWDEDCSGYEFDIDALSPESM
jgi:hypothetical protein